MQKIVVIIKQNYVYVQDIDETPLMPTYETFSQSETFIEKKVKTKVVSHDPFTIKMCYNVGKEIQKLNLGIDTGTSNIGVSLQQKKVKNFFFYI